MTAKTVSRYVTRNPEILSGEPIIMGTRTSIRAIVGLWRMGIMPEEIISHLPHLTLAQVFDALSFFLDHQLEINEYIERNQVPDELVHPSVKVNNQNDMQALDSMIALVSEWLQDESGYDEEVYPNIEAALIPD